MTKKNVNFGHAIPIAASRGENRAVEVKLEVVKVVSCPPLLNDTGLISLCHFWTKLLQKER